MHGILWLSILAAALMVVTASSLERDRRFLVDTVQGFFARKPKNQKELLRAVDGLHANSYVLNNKGRLLTGQAENYRESAAAVEPGPSKDKWQAAADSVTVLGDLVRFEAENIMQHADWIQNAYASGNTNNIWDGIEEAEQTIKAAIQMFSDLDIFSRTTSDLETLKNDPSSKDVIDDILETLKLKEEAESRYNYIVSNYDSFRQAAGMD